ncbi:MAG: divergent polysaccharide deacetylase family protein [Rhodoblastus sp.]|nr:MAG: divergent polysaccharide deacetylase family protein [Rhodoblastus sp.]
MRVNRPAGMTAPGALIIQVPQPGGVEAPALALNPAPDPRLVEKTPQGAIPRIGADGARPSEVYARPVIVGAGLKPGAPRLALYVDGLGLAPGPTQAAIALPPAVTLAFAAIGEGLARQAAAARDAGHEILLQAPMEPPDYPANDPGPDTLLASDPARNLPRLHAMMARFSGYVGLANYLGGRFLADEPALTPVLRDVAARGLIYVEDVAGERSLASALAGRLGLTVLRADVVVDRGDGAEAVKASLDRLEAMARERGAAIGAASALPVATAQIKRWAEGLEARGVALVPLSSMALAAPAPRVSGATQRKK